MGIFNKFRETIFLKEDSELERKITALKEIRDRVENKDEIDKEIKLAELGLIGEKNIAFELKNANIGMYVLHDINISYEDLNAQVDYIIITAAYCYLVECKNLIGNVTINKEGEFRREYTLNKNIIKEAIYSPYTQATRHIDILKKRWFKSNSKIFTTIFSNNFDKYYKPLVVFSNPKGMLSLSYAPKNIKSATVRADQLVEYLKNDIARIDSVDLDSKKEMESLALKILDVHVDFNKDYTEKYRINIEENKVNKDKIREKLLNLRTEKSQQRKVPAYYIFKNDELENLLKYMPNTLEELEDLKILEPIRLKLHGKEIIDIINEK